MIAYMAFSDLLFIFRFLPVFFLVYYLAPAVTRRFILLCASFVFYAMGDRYFFLLLLVSTLVNHALGKDVFRKKKGVFAAVVLLDVLLLVAFKMLGAFVDTRFLPVGISFYTFKMISYQADLFRGVIKEPPSALDTATYFTLFPQIVSGPIMRFSGMLDTGADKDFYVDPFHLKAGEYLSRLEEGAFYFIMGLSFKVLLAYHFAMCWNAIGTIGYGHLSTPLAWIGVLCYSLNLYYDFWGYSLMASGICIAIGFPFVENFRHPYAATGVADYYRRWHITLGAWFRDYVYIPLGGSKKGALRTLVNLFAVWLLTALWHGLTLNFLIWGGVLFVLIVWEKLVLSHVPVLHKFFGRLHVLFFIPLTWIVFALDKTSYLTAYFHRLFPFAHLPANVYVRDYVQIMQNYSVFFIFGLVLLVPAVFHSLKTLRRHPVIVCMLVVLFWMSVYSLVGSSGNPFMYFRF